MEDFALLTTELRLETFSDFREAAFTETYAFIELLTLSAFDLSSTELSLNVALGLRVGLSSFTTGRGRLPESIESLDIP